MNNNQSKVPTPEEYIANKDNWPDGPWKDEPDTLQWKDKTSEYDCIIVRHTILGFLCGYVVIPKTHSLYGKDDTDNFSDIDVHGGVTYAGFKGEETFCIGFDCAHMNDLQPLLFFGMEESEEVKRLKKSFSDYQTYKDINFVKEECTKLAKQLKELEK